MRWLINPTPQNRLWIINSTCLISGLVLLLFLLNIVTQCRPVIARPVNPDQESKPSQSLSADERDVLIDLFYRLELPELARDPGSISKLDLSGSQIRNHELTYLFPLANLVELNLAHTAIHSDGLEILAQLQKLSLLDLSYNDLSDLNNLDFISSLKKLKYLNLAHTDLPSESIEDLKKTNLSILNLSGLAPDIDALRALPADSLHSLEMNDAKIESHTLQGLRGMLHLQNLSLANCNLKDDVFINLNTLPDLRFLYLPGNLISGTGWLAPVLARNIPDTSANRNIKNNLIPGFQKLHLLNLSKNSIQTEYLRILIQHPSLRKLDLAGNSINGKFLSKPGSCNLRSLNLTETKITDQDFTYIKHCRKLNNLILSNTNIKGQNIKVLQNLNLIRLDLSHSKFKPYYLTRIPFHKSMQDIDLEGIPLNDSHINHLRKFTLLRKLVLNDTNTARGIINLIRYLHNLRTLEIMGTHLSKKEAELLQKNYPKIQIEY